MNGVEFLQIVIIAITVILPINFAICSWVKDLETKLEKQAEEIRRIKQVIKGYRDKETL